jgi:hypothetical protein
MRAQIFGHNLRRNESDAFKFGEFFGCHAGFFLDFAQGRLNRFFVILTAAGNKLPNVRVCAAKHAKVQSVFYETVGNG